MKTKHGIAAACAVVAASLLLGALVPTMVTAQEPDFSFEYTRSGGIAGVNERIMFESQKSFDSRLNVIKFFRDGVVIEKTLSEESVETLKHSVRNSGFFELDSYYPPANNGSADYFSHSLTITLEAQNHSVSWVDEFASSVPIPPGLVAIVGAIEDAYMNAETPEPLDQGRRRITETVVKNSVAHDAEGHASHQAAYLLLAKPGFLYSGSMTFSSNKPVDILAYHDITGTDPASLNGVAIHMVDGRTFAMTSLLKNVTSGSISVVATGLLAHVATGDEFTMVASLDVLRKVSTSSASAKQFTIDVTGERFQVRATDSETIQQLTDNFNGRNSMHVTGKLVRGDGGFNQPWGWHLDPASVRMAYISIELCDGRPSMVQDDLEYWLGTVGTYCPWSSKVVEIK